MTEFITQHLPVIIAAIVSLISVINKITPQWSVYRGPWWIKILLIVSELGSLLTSREASTFAGPLKLPLQSIRPSTARTRSTDDVSHSTNDKGHVKQIILTMILCFMFFAVIIMVAMSYGGCGSWSQSSRKSLTALNEATNSSWNVCRPIIHEKCLKAIDRCIEKKDSACPKFQSCKALRKNIATGLSAVKSAIIAAELAIRIAEQTSDDLSHSDGLRMSAERKINSARQLSSDVIALMNEAVKQ